MVRGLGGFALRKFYISLQNAASQNIFTTFVMEFIYFPSSVTNYCTTQGQNYLFRASMEQNNLLDLFQGQNYL